MLTKIKKFFLGNGALILAGILAVAFATNSVQAIARNWHLQREISRLGSEVALLRVENERLAYDIAYFKTDEYLQQAVRQKLNLRAPGEQVAVVAHDSEESGTATNTNSQAASPSPEAVSNWQAWWDFLGGRAN
jgi:cell division protein FtsB